MQFQSYDDNDRFVLPIRADSVVHRWVLFWRAVVRHTFVEPYNERRGE